MIHRTMRGRIPKKPHTVFEIDGRLCFEHCITRAGFESIFTIAWHRTPPHWVTAEEDLGRHPGWAETGWDGPLRRSHYLTGDLPEGGSPFLGRRLVVANSDLGVWLARPTEPEPTLVANADGDELTFVHAGSGRVECPLGVVPFEAHDYVWVPQGLPHRWHLDGPAHLLVVEARSAMRVPKQYRSPEGQLSMYAPYVHSDFVEPVWPSGGPETLAAPHRLIVQSGGRLTAFSLANDPFDVVGWDGQLWPFAFPISAYQPKTGAIHLPPTIHTTFAGEGYVVCSFVPRVVDYGAGAIPCPYPHSSPDCDEILFYVEGNFTSRKGVGPASITLHPRGLPHGPHPGTYEASIGTSRTDELAVMIDTFKPLVPTRHAVAIEERGYNTGWVR
ncbi:MAG: homogentisate 1,2-dioxygenase [Thermoanaerobaculales bacterium]|jgi:homogentisate 1,2-dioxygenase|nr:homogentisate 1,2-dioxygenase [Thermoanaerobaculales bacterium]